MAEIKYYTPTKDMPAAERTRAGYYAVIKSWVQEIAAEMFDKWFDISYADENYAITFSPKDENLNTRFLGMFVTAASNLQIEFPYEAAVSSSMSPKSWTLSSNPTLLIYSGSDFFIGDASTPCFYGIFGAKTFSGDSKYYIAGYRNNYLMFFIANTSPVGYNSGISTVSKGVVSEYVMQQFILSKTDAIPQNLLYVDGGLGDVPKGQFKINGHSYFTILGNIVYKID